MTITLDPPPGSTTDDPPIATPRPRSSQPRRSPGTGPSGKNAPSSNGAPSRNGGPSRTATTSATASPSAGRASAALAVAVAARPRPEAAPRSRPDLRIVRPRHRLRPGLLGTVVVSIVFVTLFVLAAMQAVLVQGQLRLDELNGGLADRQVILDKLQLRVDTLEAPDRLAREAAGLGMVEAPEVVFLYAKPLAVAPSQIAEAGR